MKDFKGDRIDTMDRLLRKQLRAGKSSRPQQCGGFDPDQAAAYFEKALSPTEQQSYERHLADCHSCRKLYTDFFQFATESEETAVETVEPAQKPRFSLDALRAWIFGPQLRWVLPAALVLIIA